MVKSSTYWTFGRVIQSGKIVEFSEFFFLRKGFDSKIDSRFSESTFFQQTHFESFFNFHPILAKESYQQVLKTPNKTDLPTMACVPWTPPWRFPLWWSFLGASILGLPKSRPSCQEWTRLMWGVRELWGPSQVLRKAGSHGEDVKL